LGGYEILRISEYLEDKLTLLREDEAVTTIHILNFVIPIVCIVIIGLFLDRMCKPDSPIEENREEE